MSFKGQAQALFRSMDHQHVRSHRVHTSATVAVLLFVFACLLLKADTTIGEHPLSKNLTFGLALDVNTDSARVHCALGYTYLDERNLERAKIEFERALTFDRNLAEAYHGLGLVLQEGARTKQQAIEYFQKAIALKPDDIEAHYDLGKIYCDYGEEKLARRAFIHVVELDSVYREVCYYLGMLEKLEAVYYRSILKRSAAQEAIQWFDRQIEYDPHHGNSYIECGELYFLMDTFSEAIPYFQEVKMVQEANPWADLFLGWCYYQLLQDEMADQYFKMALALMAKDERKLYAEPLLLLSGNENESYQLLLEGDRDDYWRKYWAVRDPTPTTKINERLIEHYFRVSYSRRYFSEGQSPWDRRGEMFIRYGEPDFRSPNFRSYPIPVYQRLETLSGVSPPIGHDGMPVYQKTNSETWIYFDLIKPSGAQFVFTDQTMTGRYDIPAGTGEYQPAIQAEAAIAEQVEVYHHDYQAEPLDFPFDMADFRGGPGESSLEICYGIPLGTVQSLQAGGQEQPAIETSVAIFDQDWHRLASDEEELIFTGKISDDQRGNLAVDIFCMNLSPGTYHFAIQARDAESKKIGIYQDELTVEDYSSSDLMISDLQLAESITPATEEGKLIKHGLKVIPHPVKQYRLSQPVYLYFESYNLSRDADGRTHFKTDYTLSSLKSEKKVASAIIAHVGEMVGFHSKQGEITVSYEKRGASGTEVGYTGIDMKVSPQGEYQLTVTVEDLNSGKSVQKSVLFTLLK